MFDAPLPLVRANLDRVEGIVWGAEDAVPMLVLVLADIGSAFNGPAVAYIVFLGSGGERPVLTLEDVEPVEDKVDVMGINRLLLGL